MPLWDAGERSRGSSFSGSTRAQGALLSARRQGARVCQSSIYLLRKDSLPRRLLTPAPPVSGTKHVVFPPQ